MGIFDKIVDDLENRSKLDQKIPDVSYNISNNPTFNPAHLKYQLTQNINNINDRELFELLKNNYKDILEELFNNGGEYAVHFSTNTRLLTLFIQVLGSVQLDPMQRVYCNKIAYDYMTGDFRKDDFIMSLYMNLSRTINRDIIPGLLGIGLPEDLAAKIALARYSNLDDGICIRRINGIIVMQPLALMNEQMIIWIYEKLTNKASVLFNAMMYDVYTEDELENISKDAKEVYGNIALATLAIVEQMPESHIRQVLINYTENYGMTKKTMNSRFSIKSISVSDHSRILKVVDDLEKLEMVYVP